MERVVRGGDGAAAVLSEKSKEDVGEQHALDRASSSPSRSSSIYLHLKSDEENMARWAEKNGEAAEGGSGNDSKRLLVERLTEEVVAGVHCNRSVALKGCNALMDAIVADYDQKTPSLFVMVPSTRSQTLKDLFRLKQKKKFLVVFLCALDLSPLSCGRSGRGFVCEVNAEEAKAILPAIRASLFDLRLLDLPSKVLFKVDAVLGAAEGFLPANYTPTTPSDPSSTKERYTAVTPALLMEELAQWEDVFAADTTTSPTDAHNGAVDDGATSAGLDEMFTTEQGVREAKVLTKHAYTCLQVKDPQLRTWFNNESNNVAMTPDANNQVRWVKACNALKWKESNQQERREALQLQEHQRLGREQEEAADALKVLLDSTTRAAQNNGRGQTNIETGAGEVEGGKEEVQSQARLKKAKKSLAVLEDQLTHLKRVQKSLDAHEEMQAQRVGKVHQFLRKARGRATKQKLPSAEEAEDTGETEAAQKDKEAAAAAELGALKVVCEEEEEASVVEQRLLKELMEEEIWLDAVVLKKERGLEKVAELALKVDKMAKAIAVEAKAAAARAAAVVGTGALSTANLLKTFGALIDEKLEVPLLFAIVPLHPPPSPLSTTSLASSRRAKDKLTQLFTSAACCSFPAAAATRPQRKETVVEYRLVFLCAFDGSPVKCGSGNGDSDNGYPIFKDSLVLQKLRPALKLSLLLLKGLTCMGTTTHMLKTHRVQGATTSGATSGKTSSGKTSSDGSEGDGGGSYSVSGGGGSGSSSSERSDHNRALQTLASASQVLASIPIINKEEDALIPKDLDELNLCVKTAVATIDSSSSHSEEETKHAASALKVSAESFRELNQWLTLMKDEESLSAHKKSDQKNLDLATATTTTTATTTVAVGLERVKDQEGNEDWVSPINTNAWHSSTPESRASVHLLVQLRDVVEASVIGVTGKDLTPDEEGTISTVMENLHSLQLTSVLDLATHLDTECGSSVVVLAKDVLRVELKGQEGIQLLWRTLRAATAAEQSRLKKLEQQKATKKRRRQLKSAGLAATLVVTAANHSKTASASSIEASSSSLTADGNDNKDVLNLSPPPSDASNDQDSSSSIAAVPWRTCGSWNGIGSCDVDSSAVGRSSSSMDESESSEGQTKKKSDSKKTKTRETKASSHKSGKTTEMVDTKHKTPTPVSQKKKRDNVLLVAENQNEDTPLSRFESSGKQRSKPGLSHAVSSSSSSRTTSSSASSTLIAPPDSSPVDTPSQGTKKSVEKVGGGDGAGGAGRNTSRTITPARSSSNNARSSSNRPRPKSPSRSTSNARRTRTGSSNSKNVVPV